MSSRKSSVSPSTTSEPPPASSWAAPPEFYLDENIAGRSIAGCLRGLGYVVHTPPELYGDRATAEGTPDEIWLGDVARRGWVVISRDAKILERPAEVAAYKAAKVHRIFYPGQATRETLVEAVHATLIEVGAISSRCVPGVWRVQRSRGRWHLTEV